MDIYERKSKWKWYLGIAGFIVLMISMLYTNYLANQLSKGEETKVKLYVNALNELSKKYEEAENADTGGIEDDLTDFLTEDLTAQLNTVNLLDDVPVILVGETGAIDSGRNFGDEKRYRHRIFKNRIRKN